MEAGNILIVEDDRLVAEDLELALKGFGYWVTGTSASAADAIWKIEEQSPDLVLMDIQLRGEGDGITAADWIRQHQDIPVIYLSAYADEPTLQRAKATARTALSSNRFKNDNCGLALKLLFLGTEARKKRERRRRLLLSNQRCKPYPMTSER